MSLPEGAETLQNNIAQLCELWYVKIMNKCHWYKFAGQKKKLNSSLPLDR